MNNSLVRITKEISFDDLRTGKISKIEAYEALVKKWIIEPAETLAKSHPDETDHGMALLALELMFFEPQGQFLTGETSFRRSKKTFCRAFDDFRKLLRDRDLIPIETDSLPSKSIYKWARCGLFHSGRLSDELLVDAVGYTSKCLEKNDILDGWLVNPWKMLPAIDLYVNTYVAKLEKDGNDELQQNFSKTFDRLVNYSNQAGT